jgi:hypothetical protein
MAEWNGHLHEEAEMVGEARDEGVTVMQMEVQGLADPSESACHLDYRGERGLHRALDAHDQIR